MKPLKILVVTGSSGGHIFPALGLLGATKLKDIKTDLLLVLPKNKNLSVAGNLAYKIRYISIKNLKLAFRPSSLISILSFLQGSLESLFIILLFRPALVVGFGSIVSIPLILLARSLRIKTIIHEQNIIPGKANKFLAGPSNKIAVSFARTKEYLGGSAGKTVVTGNPIRQELTRMDKNKALGFFGFSNDKLTILVMGGSAGSRRINREFFKAITTMPDKKSLQVIHLTGEEDYDLLKNNYHEANASVKIFNFLVSMQYAYNASDLVVCRAGATTVAELIFFRLPAILVPYPYAYAHQMANAELLGEIGSAMIIEEGDFDAAMLKLVLGELINNSLRLKQMRGQYAGIPVPDAKELLADAALSLVKVRR